MLDYRIITKEDYRKFILNNISACSISSKTNEHIENMWSKLSEGYNFAIAVGKEDEPMFYSVDYFNEHVLQGKSKTNGSASVLTVKLNLDTTEFEEKLSRIEKQSKKINPFLTMLEFEKSMNEVKKIATNNNIEGKRAGYIIIDEYHNNI